jgi:hypothetical protein
VEQEEEGDRKARLEHEVNWQAQKAEEEAIKGFDSLRS